MLKKGMRILLAKAIAVLLFITTSCNKDNNNDIEIESRAILDKYFTIENAYPNKDYPSPSPDSINPPVIDEITGEQILPVGGKTTIEVTISKPVQSVIVGIDTTGYFYEIDKETADTKFSFDFAFNEEPEIRAYNLYFTAIENDTLISQPKTLKIITINGVVENLEVKCEWDNPVDIDIFLKEPNDEIIYYDNRSSENMGYINRDSNPFCWLDSLNEESIIYDENSAVEIGEYKVMMRYFSSCDISDTTNYSVSVLFNDELLDLGSTPNPFTGKLAADETDDQPFDLFNFSINSGLKSTASNKLMRIVIPREENSLTPEKKPLKF